MIPHDLREIFTIQIPKLHPRGVSYLALRPTSSLSHPFILHEIPGLAYSNLEVFDRWQPPAQRHGLVTIITHQMNGSTVHRIVQLPPNEQPNAPPTSAPQRRTRFSGVALTSFNVTNDGKHGVVTDIEDRTARMRRRSDAVQISLRAFPFSLRTRNFCSPISRTFSIADLHGDTWTRDQYTVGSFCMASGTALLCDQDAMVDTPAGSVVILHFD